MKHAILFAVPGTSCQGAEAAYLNIERRARARFAGVGVRWGYTSGPVRRKLAARGQTVDSPAGELSAMRSAGFTHVVVQPLHFTPGMEYQEMVEKVQAFGSGPSAFDRLVVGKPMLQVPGDFARAAAILLEDTPAADDSVDALVLVAHGSRRAGATDAFVRAQAECADLDKPVFVATLTGVPGIAETIEDCRTAGIGKVCLVPFMVAGGLSARNEIAGTGPDSCRALLEAEGIACIPVVMGLGEFDRVADIWLDRVEQMLKTIELNES